MKLEVINRYHQDRVFVEEFIRQKYLGIFYAKITKFPSILLALTDGGQIKASCGIRTSLDGFFSQVYCDQPLQQIIESKEFQRNAKVYEIVNLVSSGPIASIRLVKELNKFFLDRSGDFVLFSASQNLRTFLTLMGLDMISIQKAEKHRIPNPEQWGSYYETNPVVCYCKVPKLTLSVLFKNLRKQSHAQFAQVAQ